MIERTDALTHGRMSCGGVVAPPTARPLDRPTAGTTLIELIVVLAIIAIMFGVAIPALVASPAKSARANLADSALRLAVAAGRPIRLAGDSGRAILALPDGRVLHQESADAR